MKIENNIVKAALFGLLFFFYAQSGIAQNEDKIYKIVYEMPDFPGGPDSLGIFLSKNVKYPYSDRLNKIEGVVFLSFVIEKDGSISNINIDEKASKEATDDMKREAIRVIESMPNWIPGKFDNGSPARVAYNLPIGFRLGTGKKSKRR